MSPRPLATSITASASASPRRTTASTVRPSGAGGPSAIKPCRTSASARGNAAGGCMPAAGGGAATSSHFPVSSALIRSEIFSPSISA